MSLLAACASEGVLTWEPETPEERALREQAAALQSTVGEGGLSGALIGALAGAALGGVEGAFAGARMGRFAGAGAGLYVKQLQADYADREARLEAVARDMETTIEETEAALDSMRAVLAQQQARLAELEGAVARNAASSAQLERQQTRARTNLDEMRRAIAGAEAREAIFRETRAIVLTNAPETAEAPRAQAVDDYLAVLSNRIGAMRDIAETLANDI